MQSDKEKEARFTGWSAFFTVLFALAACGGGLAYMVSKPSFGGHFDCGWDYRNGTTFDCRTPNFSWWGPAGLVPFLCGSIVILLVIFLFLVRYHKSSLLDSLTTVFASLVGVITAAVIIYFGCMCCWYPRRVRGVNLHCNRCKNDCCRNCDSGDCCGQKCFPRYC